MNKQTKIKTLFISCVYLSHHQAQQITRGLKPSIRLRKRITVKKIKAFKTWYEKSNSPFCRKKDASRCLTEIQRHPICPHPKERTPFCYLECFFKNFLIFVIGFCTAQGDKWSCLSLQFDILSCSNPFLSHNTILATTLVSCML